MILENFKRYIVDIGDPRTTYYLSYPIIRALGFTNTSQTLHQYCKYSQTTYIENKDIYGYIRKVKRIVIPEADVLRLYEAVKVRYRPSRRITIAYATKVVEEYDIEIKKLEQEIEVNSKNTLSFLETHHAHELKELDEWFGLEMDKLRIRHDKKVKMLHMSHRKEKKNAELQPALQHKIDILKDKKQRILIKSGYVKESE